MKETVLITGASSGIGYELAQIFAKNHYNLILIARRDKRLNEMSKKFYKNFKTNTIVLVEDLTKTNTVEEIVNKIKNMGINIDILINNAGIGYCGLFHEIDLKNHNKTIELNIVALTKLTKLISIDMVNRRKGRILNVASTGAYQPGPLISVYYATKAYVLSFSEALYNELKPYNITVSTLCPGTTMTEFSNNAGKGDLKSAMSPERVAKITYNQLMRGKRIIIPGVLNKILIFFSKITPRRILAAIVRKIQYKAMKI
ncbi:SDR family NAD(P)-dependent oxidoreductase [Clostridium rectalis]|uniref:SDR family NAD(P)-dependent oxidoreductase n=1 Tax=Clostridium rectalis TaxID=2040295 RepID=UPI000F63296D|nr:SDR family oxidoreductase [Clostridium rectalis]